MKALIFAIGIILILGVGALWLHATPAPAAPQTAAEQIEGQSIPTGTPTTSSTPTIDVGEIATTSNVFSASTSIAATNHTIGVVTAAPNIIPTNVSTTVIVTAVITDLAVISNSVNLLRLGPAGTQPTILGHLQGNGSGTYSIQISLNQSTATQIQLELSAAFRGTLQRVLSPMVPILVLSMPPATFSVNEGFLSLGGPLSFNNFNNVYLEGGLIPPGGATINVTSIPLPTTSLSIYIATADLPAATISSTDTLMVSGLSCTQVFYSAAYDAASTYNGEAVYCPSANILYKFYLTYTADDPNASQYLAAFQGGVTSSVTLTH